MEASVPVEPPVQAVNVSKNGCIVARRVEWAGSSPLRRRGLLGYASLDAEAGMYLAPCQWIHTFRMRFSIDVAFLGKDGRVLTVHHRLKPNRLSRIVLRAEGALELPAGRLHDTNTEVGDIVQFADPRQRSEYGRQGSA